MGMQAYVLVLAPASADALTFNLVLEQQKGHACSGMLSCCLSEPSKKPEPSLVSASLAACHQTQHFLVSKAELIVVLVQELERFGEQQAEASRKQALRRAEKQKRKADKAAAKAARKRHRAAAAEGGAAAAVDDGAAEPEQGTAAGQQEAATPPGFQDQLDGAARAEAAEAGPGLAEQSPESASPESLGNMFQSNEDIEQVGVCLRKQARMGGLVRLSAQCGDRCSTCCCRRLGPKRFALVPAGCADPNTVCDWRFSRASGWTRPGRRRVTPTM